MYDSISFKHFFSYFFNLNVNNRNDINLIFVDSLSCREGVLKKRSRYVFVLLNINFLLFMSLIHSPIVLKFLESFIIIIQYIIINFKIKKSEKYRVKSQISSRFPFYLLNILLIILNVVQFFY
ncbi:hypothetical protein V6Z12_A09G044900 [Gossypium hirsutum]